VSVAGVCFRVSSKVEIHRRYDDDQGEYCILDLAFSDALSTRFRPDDMQGCQVTNVQVRFDCR
jgi:hypothetical protein